jgi:multiple sugar transport system ATP-binding protein
MVYHEGGGGENNIRGKAEVVEPLGADIHIYVSTKNNQLIARVPPRWDFKVGDELNFTPDKARLHFFDIDTEKALAI